MTMLRDIIAELVGMFVGDAPLAGAILVVVALTAALTELTPVAPLLGGALLLIGCLLVLTGSVLWAGRRKN